MKAKFTNGNFVFVDEKAYKYLYRVNLDKDSIVLPNIGANCGEVYYITPTDLPYQKNVLGPNAILVRSKNNNNLFLYYLLNTPACQKGISLLIGSSGQPKYNKTDFASMFINVPESENEQIKIGNLLSRIDRMKYIVEEEKTILKKYKEGTISFFIDSIDTHNIMTLDKLCSITTGKLDANAMNENGTYKFFTCSKQDYLINTYAFDAEALLISGNGDVGLCKYYKGKFNAYQRTYVLTDFKINPIYIKCCFEKQINTIVRSETNKGAMPYIRREMFSKIKIPIPETNKINECTRISSCFEDLISITERKISILEQLKSFLNKNMFI